MSERLKKGDQGTKRKTSDEMRAKGNVSKIIVDTFGSNKLPGNKGEIKDIDDIMVGYWTSMSGGMPKSEKPLRISEWEERVLPGVIEQVREDMLKKKRIKK